MKHIVRKSVLLALSALIGGLALPAAAQTTGADWRPFRVWHTYYYERTTTPVHLETVRLAAGRLEGADSVYAFNDFYRATSSNDVYSPNCPRTGNELFRREENTLVGAELQLVAGVGDYFLRFAGGAALRLPRRPPAVGASWILKPGVSATVTRLEVRAVGAGAAAVADSVWVAMLSTGDEMIGSKSFGLVQTPPLLGIGSAQIPIFILRLLTIPERRVGQLATANLPAWQVGDSLVRTESTFNFWNPAFGCSSVTSLAHYTRQTLSANADTVYLHGFRKRVVNYSGAPGCPAAATVVDPPISFRSARYVGPPAPPAPTRGQLLQQPSRPTGNGVVNVQRWFVAPAAGECFPGWRTRYETYFGVDSCRQTLNALVDQGGWYEAVDGFGTVSDATTGSVGQMVWYRRGGQTCGQRPNLSALLAAPKLLPASAVQLYPNPATTTARLNLTGTKGGALTLTATDALGRRVWQHTQVVGAEADIALPVDGWAPGVYYVRVALGEGVRVVRE